MSDIIACFGDSIIQGYGERPQRGWVGRLKDYFESKKDHNFVYNFGFSGHTSEELSKYFNTEWESISKLELLSSNYLLLFGVGTNDSRWQGLPENGNVKLHKETFRENIEILIDEVYKMQNHKVNSIFIGLTPVDESKTIPYEEVISFKNERIQLFNNIIKTQCARSAVSFLNMFDIMSKEDYKKLLYDGVHPNSEGYNFMFEVIKDFIKKDDLIHFQPILVD